MVDAADRLGRRLLFLGLTGGEESNDHHPYYELLFRGQAGASDLSFARGQRFFYDVAGMEGFEWYLGWPLLTIPSIIAGFVVFTTLKAI